MHFQGTAISLMWNRRETELRLETSALPLKNERVFLFFFLIKESGL